MKLRALVAARALARIAAVALTVVEAQAQTAPAAGATAGLAGPAPSPVFGMVQGLVGLVIVIGLIFVAGWLMRKVGPRARAGGVVQVVGGASVGPREKVVVVRFAGQTLLLGVAAGQVTMLHAANPTDVVEDPVATTSARPSSFAERLRAARGGA